MSVLKKLSDIQCAFKIGKNKHNKFGGFDYRNIEDMLTELKPLLKQHGCALYFTEKIEMVADRIYVVSTATIVDAETNGSFSSTAYAREPLAKKGMDESQITGSTTSYARKYALSGLLSVDNGAADPDDMKEIEEAPEPIKEERGTNGLTLLKMVDEIDTVKPGYSAKLCAKNNVNDVSELSIDYIEKAWNYVCGAKKETT